MNLSLLSLRVVSSLHKQFPEEPFPAENRTTLTALRNETVSFQVLARVQSAAMRAQVTAAVESPLGDLVRMRRVQTVPVRLAAFANADDNYLRKTPGLYPDLLEEYHGEAFWLNPGETISFWIDARIPSELAPGDYPVVFRFFDTEQTGHGASVREARLTLTVQSATLPDQELICTQWFHTDCLAEYYQLPVFSEEYWATVEAFMREAVACGTNMILTPTFTPALDTQIGGERLTVQLVDVTVDESGTYSFGFDRLKRWVALAHRVGIRYFEMAHLFTQWGAAWCPKVMAHTPDGEKQIFGWDTPADGEAYLAFLNQYLPALTAQLRAWGIAGQCYFHLSDEPSMDALPHYLKLKQAVEPLLEGFVMMDALSHYDFYAQGAVAQPVVALDAAQPFLDHHVSPLWVYYCCSQGITVSNRFIAMPSARNRMLGFQMYLKNVQGFLHWGFNFYHNDRSAEQIDPYRTADGNGTWPAGDPFLVYPGADRQPRGSIREMVFAEGLQDLRACRLLEQRIGRDRVCAMLREAGVRGFFDYPQDAATLLALREQINTQLRLS